MFNRLFGKKKTDAKNASSEQVVEPEKSSQDKATESMMTIRETIKGLQKKVDDLTKSSEEQLREAAKLKKNNPNDPRIKQILTKVKKDRENIQKYNAVIIKQESNLTAVDDAAFISEMYTVMEQTRDAMKSAIDGINDKMRDIMDEIEDQKQDIADVMDLLVTNDTEEADLDDIENELDQLMAEEKKSELPEAPAVPTTAVPTTAVPATALPSVPTTEVAKPAEDDLDDMLAELDNL